MPHHIIARILGLQSNGNHIGAPLGALRSAKNCLMVQPETIEPRFGFDGVGAALITAGRTIVNGSVFFAYDSKIYLLCDSGYLARYDGSSWVVLTGTSTVPLLATEGRRVRAVQVRNNCYLSTAQRVDTSDIVATAGISRGLDMEYALTGASGWMTNNTRVAYRMTWSLTDNESNLWEGAPSGRLIVENAAGGTRDVQLTFTVPADITTSYTYNLYRSVMTQNVTDEPTDELQLVKSGKPTSAQITARLVSNILDDLAEGARGASLYTNESQEGALQENNRPPAANDIALYKRHLFFGGIVSGFPHRRIRIRKIGSGADALSSGTFTADASVGTPTLSNVSSFSGIRIGKRVTGTGLAAGTIYYVLSYNTGAATITLSANATGSAVGATYTYYETLCLQADTTAGAIWGGSTETIASGIFQIYTGGTVTANLEDTARSIARVTNRYAFATRYSYGNYAGTSLDPGQLLIEARIAGFAISASTGDAYDPPLPLPFQSPSVALEITDTVPGRLRWTKPDEPEAAPTTQYVDIGDSKLPIRRLAPLRDGLLIFKDDGVYRLSGEDSDNFRLDLLDASIKLWAPRTVDVVRNTAIALCTEGLFAITESGTSRIPISDPVDDQLRDYYDPAVTSTRDLCWAIGVDSPALYVLVLQTADLVETPLVLVYDVSHETWTNWYFPYLHLQAGGVSSDSRIYLAGARHDPDQIQDYIYAVLRERRDAGLARYSDDTYALTATSVSGDAIYISEYMQDLFGATGDLVVQGGASSRISSFTDLERDQFTCDITSASNVLTFCSSVNWATIAIGDLIEDLSDPPAIPGGTTVQSWNQGALTITMSADATGTYEDAIARRTAAIERDEFSCDITSGNNVLSACDGVNWTNIAVGDPLTHLDTPSAIPAGATVQSWSASAATITMSANATGTWTNTDVRRTSVTTPPRSITVDDGTGFGAGALTVYRSYPVEIEFLPQHAGNPAEVKHWDEFAWLFQRRELDQWSQAYRSDVTGEWTSVTRIEDSNTIEHPLRSFLPHQVQRCSQLGLRLSAQRARTHLRLEGAAISYTPAGRKVRG